MKKKNVIYLSETKLKEVLGRTIARSEAEKKVEKKDKKK